MYQQQGRSTLRSPQQQFKTKGIIKDRSQDLIQAKRLMRLKKDKPTTKFMNKLPPQWIDKTDEVKDNIVKVNDICNQMAQLRIEKSKIPFTQTEQIVAQKISDRVEHATSIMRECEDILATLGQSNWNESDDEAKMKMNAKMALTLGLQEVAQKLKIFQREVVQDYQQKSTLSSTSTNIYQQQQMEQQQIIIDNFEVEFLEQMATDRNDRIRGLGEKMQKLTELFRELNKLVIEQGTLLDRIDFNLETMYVNTKKGRQELQKANETSQVSGRAQNCICVLVVLNIAIIIVLVLKFTIF